MIINQSNLRLNHLQQVGQKLDIYSDNVPDGLSEDQSKMQQKRQKVILEYYRSDLSDWNNWQWQIANSDKTERLFRANGALSPI